MSDLASAGASGYRNRVRKFARVDNLAAITSVMWDGANGAIAQPDYPGWLPEESTIEAVSSSVNDAVAGSGAYALEITGQGDDGIEKTDVVILEGQIPVAFSEKFQIIYTAQVVNLDAQSNGNTSPILGANNGLITIYKQGSPLVILAAINATLGRTQMAIWRCPKNKYGEFRKIGVYPQSGKPVIAQLFARNNINESWVNVGQFDQDGFLAEPTWPQGSEEYISPGTDLCLVVKVANPGTSVSSLLWVNLHDIPNYNQLLLEAESN